MSRISQWGLEPQAVIKLNWLTVESHWEQVPCCSTRVRFNPYDSPFQACSSCTLARSTLERLCYLILNLIWWQGTEIAWSCQTEKAFDLHKDNCNVLSELIASNQLRQKTPPSEIRPCKPIPNLQYHFSTQQHMSGLIMSDWEANYNFNQQNGRLSELRIQRFLQTKLLVNPVENVSPANKYPACHLAERVICLRCGPWSLHVPQRRWRQRSTRRVKVCPVILAKLCAGGGFKGAGVSGGAVCQLCLLSVSG